MILKFADLKRLSKVKTVYTAGSFDLLHRGHVDFLKGIRLKFPRHKVVLGLLPDKRVTAKKGPGRPVIKQRDRLLVIDCVRYVDYSFICPVYKNGQDSTFLILRDLRPEFVVFPDRRYQEMKERFGETGSTLIIQGKTSDRSTSKILNRIRQC
jgi:D-beta-D-heptose 7-phosphate kinase/D-beta-D-heptose 1-phosphate adenosyltransferase